MEDSSEKTCERRKLKDERPIIAGGRLPLILIFVALGAVMYLAKIYIFGDITIDVLVKQKDLLLIYYLRHPFTAIVSFVSLYVICTALTIPVAVPLTVLGGMVFGLWLGTVLVSFSSTLGATLSFLFARHFLGDWVTRKFPGPLRVVNQIIEKEGVY